MKPTTGDSDGDCDRGAWRFDGHGYFGIELAESYHFAPFEMCYLSVGLRSADHCKFENQVAIEHWMAILVPVALVALLVFL